MQFLAFKSKQAVGYSGIGEFALSPFYFRDYAAHFVAEVGGLDAVARDRGKAGQLAREAVECGFGQQQLEREGAAFAVLRKLNYLVMK